MYHPYKLGYNLLPQLRKISPKDVFTVTADRLYYLEQKQLSLKTQKCDIEQEMDKEIDSAASRFIVDHYPEKLDGPLTLENLAPQIQEDVAIHRLSDEKDWLAAIHFCFPGGWSPEEKIGKTFTEIHEPIPGMNLSNSRKLVEASIDHGPFERFVWGVIYENHLNYHKAISRKKFDPSRPEFFIKVERQMTVGLPEHRSFMFIVRLFILPEQEVDKPALYKALDGMNAEQRVYKGITYAFMEYLSL